MSKKQTDDEEVGIVEAVGAIAIGLAIGAGVAALIKMLSEDK